MPAHSMDCVNICYDGSYLNKLHCQKLLARNLGVILDFSLS